MLKIIHRYLAANFILPFFLSTIFFVLFLLAFQMFKIVGLVINKGVGLDVLFEMVYHVAITFVPMAIPLSLLFTSIYVLGRMSEDSEIIVMRSVGLSRFQIFLPLLIVSLTIALTTLTLSSSFIPKSKREFKKLLTFLTNKGFLSDISSGNFYSQIPGVTIFASDVENSGEILKEVFIQIQSESTGNNQVIMAKEGRLVKDQNLETGLVALKLNLIDGNIIKENQEKKQFEKILFKNYDFPILTSDLSKNLVTKNSMKSFGELRAFSKLSEEELRSQGSNLRDQFDGVIEFWSRINNAILCPIFAFIGFVFGIQNARGKRRNTAFVCLMILIGYYSVFFGSLALAKDTQSLAVLTIFFPSILILFLGSYYWKKLQWS